MSEREREQHSSRIEEPDAAEPSYQAKPGAASAPARDEQAIEERAATIKTTPMGRTLSSEQTTGERTSSSERQFEEPSGGLIQDQKWQYFAGQWDVIQAGFVDDPRKTVEQADRLVGEVVQHLAKVFSDERARLESQWSRGGQVGTEELRLAMQHYRDFFRTLVGR